MRGWGIAGIALIWIGTLCACEPGPAWRTATWNTCLTSVSSSSNPAECRAKVHIRERTRRVVEAERVAIGDLLLEPDMYSFHLQEVCESDVRWIAAYVANDGVVPEGGSFGPEHYAAIDIRAPYAFLPYETDDVTGAGDHGCGEGVSSGMAVIVKNEAEREPPTTRGLTNATYEARLGIPFSYEQLQKYACDAYFDAQVDTTTEPAGEETGFRTNGCKSGIALSTVRGLACVQTSWRSSPGDDLLRATSCAAHTIGGGDANQTNIRNLQLAAVVNESVEFAENGPLMVGGDFNYRDQQAFIESMIPALREVADGPTHRFDCENAIDGLYVRGWNLVAESTTECEVMDNAPALEWLRFGDFDGDGTTDVFFGHPSGQWRYSPGGTGLWRDLNWSGVPLERLRFGDFDGDGRTDVFDREQSGQWRYSDDAVANWRPLNRSDAQLEDLRFYDFDGDGATDVFHRDASGQWRYSASGRSKWQNLRSDPTPLGELFFGDFDGDRKTDVFHRAANGDWRVSYRGAEDWVVLRRDDAPANELRIGNFDDDARADVFRRDDGGQWFISRGGILDWELVNESGIPLNDLRFGDFEGDGVMDVFSMTAGLRRWQYSDDARSLWAPLADVLQPLDYADPFSFSDHVLVVSPRLMPSPRAKSDFDGDGQTDVFHRDATGQWWMSSGALTTWQALNGSQVPAHELRFGDFDGDRRTDVFHRDTDGQWRFSSAGLVDWQNLNRSEAPGDELRFGDFDGDGVTDVFHRAENGQWRFSSGGLADWQNLNRSQVPGDELRFGDFDRDGRTDVFHRHTSGRWRVSSGGVENWQNLNRSEVPGNELRFGDFDGDGATDVFHRAASGQWRYSWRGLSAWRNLNHSQVPGDELRFGDFDGDGITDVFHRDTDGQWRFSKRGLADWQDLQQSDVPLSGLLFEE